MDLTDAPEIGSTETLNQDEPIPVDDNGNYLENMFGEMWYITIIAVALVVILLCIGILCLLKRRDTRRNSEGVFKDTEMHQTYADSSNVNVGELEGANMLTKQQSPNVVPTTPDSDGYTDVNVDFATATIKATPGGTDGDFESSSDDGGNKNDLYKQPPISSKGKDEDSDAEDMYGSVQNTTA